MYTYKKTFHASTHKSTMTGRKIVFVYASWCGWCKKFKEEQLAATNKVLQQRGLPVMDEFDSETACKDAPAHLSGAQGVPMFIFLNGQDQILGTLAGYKKAQDLVDHLEQLPDNTMG